MKTDDLQYQLEELIDKSNLVDVVEQLAQICRLKADHIESNWQDSALAKRWIKAANAIENVKLPSL
jgi:hypothetical protein